MTRIRTPKLHKIISLWLAIAGLLIILLPFDRHAADVSMNVLALLTIPTILAAGFIMWQQGYRPAHYYLLAWVAFLGGIGLFLLSNLSLLPKNAVTQHSMLIGTILTVLLLSLALADRINTIKQEKAEAQASALEALQKNEKLARQQSIILEKRVKERTAELEQEITERKRVEEKLQESEKLYRDLVENISEVIYAVNENGVVTYVSPTIESFIGYSPSEITGRYFRDFILQEELPSAREGFQQVLADHIATNEYRILTKSGEIRWIRTSSRPTLIGERVTGMYGVLSDITERKQAEESLQRAHAELERRVEERTAELAKTNASLKAEIAERKQVEEQIKASLREKEVLLKEIHHRVKNNLQVISSLLNLQSGYIEDEQVMSIFQDSQHRVRSMALIHEKLYRSENLAQIDFGEYIQDLGGYLFHSQNARWRGITLAIQAEQVFMPIDTAVPCGLILNELISNSLKHAFPDGQTGEVRIELAAKDDHQLVLRVGDNGIGFPQEMDFQDADSLGLLLVNTLVKQLHGTIELHRNGGAEFEITFAVP